MLPVCVGVGNLKALNLVHTTTKNPLIHNKKYIKKISHKKHIYDAGGPKDPCVGNWKFGVSYIFKTSIYSECSQIIWWRLDKNSIFHESS